MEPQVRYGQVAKRLVVGLTAPQWDWIRDRSNESGIPMNEVVRQAIDEVRRRAERKKS